MKNPTVKKAAIALSAAALVTTSGCSIVNRVAKQLEGEWDIQSWEIEGYDYMSYFQSASIDFGAAEDGEGEFDWEWTDDFGDRYTFDGDFQLNDDADEIDMETNFSGYAFDLSFDLEIDGDDLQLEGTGFSGYSWVVEAERN